MASDVFSHALVYNNHRYNYPTRHPSLVSSRYHGHIKHPSTSRTRKPSTESQTSGEHRVNPSVGASTPLHHHSPCQTSNPSSPTSSSPPPTRPPAPSTLPLPVPPLALLVDGGTALRRRIRRISVSAGLMGEGDRRVPTMYRSIKWNPFRWVIASRASSAFSYTYAMHDGKRDISRIHASSKERQRFSEHFPFGIRTESE